MAALAVAGIMLSSSPAQAGWWHWRTGCGGYGYGCYPAYVYTTSYCSPCMTACGCSCWYPCYDTCCSPCWSPCYSSCCDCVLDCCDAAVAEEEGTVESQEVPPAPAPAVPPPVEPQAATPPPAPAVAEEQPQERAPALPPSLEPKTVPAAPDVNLPKLPETPLPPAPGEAPKPTAGRSVPANSALLSVAVPQDARVYVNGKLTQTPGAQRQFVSHGLLDGYNYTYEMRVVVTRNGQELSDTQVVRVRAGQVRDLSFDFDGRANAVLAARLP